MATVYAAALKRKRKAKKAMPWVLGAAVLYLCLPFLPQSAEMRRDIYASVQDCKLDHLSYECEIRSDGYAIGPEYPAPEVKRERGEHGFQAMSYKYSTVSIFSASPVEKSKLAQVADLDAPPPSTGSSEHCLGFTSRYNGWFGGLASVFSASREKRAEKSQKI